MPLNTFDQKQTLVLNAAAVVIGSALPLAFAPFNLWPLAILLPILLIWLVDRDWPLRRVFFTGFCFGLGYFGFGVYWIYNSLHDFGQAPPLVAGGLTALMIAYLALYPAATLTVWARARFSWGRGALWLLPALWFSFEWLKGWVGTGMPWLSLGYSQTSSPMAGYAPLLGVYGIGALCILMAVAAYLIIRDRRYVLLVLLLGLPLLGGAIKQVEWTLPADTLRVTLVQGNIPQQIKWRRDQQQAIFNTYWRETNTSWNSDLIIWPETALPGNSGAIEHHLLGPMQQAAVERGTPIMSGLVVSEEDNARFYNSVVLLAEERQYYHKRHLVMFGEYYPMRWLLDLFDNLILIPYSDMSPGSDQQPQMQIQNLVLGVTICFEDAFSRDVFRDLPQANLLVNVSNDAWFGDSTAPHQHLQIAQMRSLEAERPMLRSTNTGVSAFIDHQGKLGKRSEQFKTESITASVQGRQGKTPFYYLIEWQGPLAVGGLLVTLILVRKRTISLS